MTPRASVAAVALSLGIAACGESHHMTDVCSAMRTAAMRTTPGGSNLVSQCGATAEFTPINKYQGAIAGVQQREDAVALINGSCTGTLIAAAAGPVVLTAGHCVGLGDQDLVAFNIETDPDGDRLATMGTVIEQATEPDYALLRLDQLPAATPTPLTSRSTDLLAVIQHPRGGPKVIAEGSFLAACHDQIFYADLDTLVGSSGAGVINDQGYLVGVHTDGDCAEDGSGSNRGWTSVSIVAASAYLQDSDIAER
jgi:hypothetical protein